MIKGSGVAKTETRNVAGFHTVSLGIDARVDFARATARA